MIHIGRHIFQRFFWAGCLVAALALCTHPLSADSVFPQKDWERVDPAILGWSERALNEARKTAEEVGSAAVFVVQEGRVVADWGLTSRPLALYSIRKSLLSGLYGIYVGQGLIDINKSLADIQFDDAITPLTDLEKIASIRDLLMSRSGIYIEAAYETAGMREKRPERGSYLPGTHWYYNNWDFNALGAILARITGEDLFVTIEQRLAIPTGMQDFSHHLGRYVYGESSEHPAYPLRMSARDLARFGLLYLHKGLWDGTQLIPESWVEESTKPMSPTHSGIGYGYMWWAATGKKQFLTDMGHASFSARGAGGQVLIVVPGHQLVIVHLFERSPQRRSPRRRGLHDLIERIMAAAPPIGAED
ncbi:MAG: serine hydrolase domain-containing protein [Wenzhouxiangella sp.]